MQLGMVRLVLPRRTSAPLVLAVILLGVGAVGFALTFDRPIYRSLLGSFSPPQPVLVQALETPVTEADAPPANGGYVFVDEAQLEARPVETAAVMATEAVIAAAAPVVSAAGAGSLAPLAPPSPVPAEATGATPGPIASEPAPAPFPALAASANGGSGPVGGDRGSTPNSTGNIAFATDADPALNFTNSGQRAQDAALPVAKPATDPDPSKGAGPKKPSPAEAHNPHGVPPGLQKQNQ